MQKHHQPASLRHLIPPLFVVAIALGAALSFVDLVWVGAYGLFWAHYLSASLAASLVEARREGWQLLPILPVVFWIFHFAYGLGFLRGIVHFWILRRGAKDVHAGAVRLTR